MVFPREHLNIPIRDELHASLQIATTILDGDDVGMSGQLLQGG